VVAKKIPATPAAEPVVTAPVEKPAVPETPVAPAAGVAAPGAAEKQAEPKPAEEPQQAEEKPSESAILEPRPQPVALPEDA